MPFGFPSHQGLLAPLWRVWPNRFSVLGLWVGALVPDVIDGLESIAVRGHFQQSIGHSLLGATIVGVPLGLVLTWALRCGMQRLVKLDHTGRFPEVLGRAGRWTRSVDNRCGFESPGQRFGIEPFSVWLGALSHVIFDLLSH